MITGQGGELGEVRRQFGINVCYSVIQVLQAFAEVLFLRFVSLVGWRADGADQGLVENLSSVRGILAFADKTGEFVIACGKASSHSCDGRAGLCCVGELGRFVSLGDEACALARSVVRQGCFCME